jgi:uncharacterized membrane protein
MLLKGIYTVDKYTKIQLILTLFFAVFYANISIVNHLNFRTNWFDLGFYTHHIYDYAHFNFAHLKTNLSDHFDLFLIVIAPLQYLFGQYTLLVVQIFFMLIGSYGVFLYSNAILKDKHKALILQITFLLCFAVISSIAFDYHSNVIAACLIPFLLYYFKTEKKWKFIFLWLMIIFTKENVMFNTSVLVVLLPFFHKESKLKRISLALGIIGLIMFWLIVSKVMPAFSNTAVYFNFRYTNVGNSKSFSDMFVFIITHPFETLKLLFINTRNNPLFDHYKTEAHIFIFLSGGFLLLRKPVLLLMSIPLYFQKFLHDSQNVWGLSFQYNIDFVPIIFMAIISFLEKDYKWQLNKNLVYIFLFINIILTIRMMDNTVSFVKKSSLRIYQGMHYTSEINKNTFKELSKLIPEKSSVCAQSFFTPHFSLRDSIFQFDEHDHKTEYIIVADSTQPYPLTAIQFQERIDTLLKDTAYRLIADKDNIKLFKRN